VRLRATISGATEAQCSPRWSNLLVRWLQSRFAPSAGGRARPSATDGGYLLRMFQRLSAGGHGGTGGCEKSVWGRKQGRLRAFRDVALGTSTRKHHGYSSRECSSRWRWPHRWARERAWSMQRFAVHAAIPRARTLAGTATSFGLAPPVGRNCARDREIAPHKTAKDPPRPVVSLQNARTSVPRRSLKHQTHALRPSLLITFISNTFSWHLPAQQLSA
jgi:hypothetical protein